MWVNRHRLNNSLVVFIHGIYGSSSGTWKSLPELLQAETLRDPIIGSYDIYLYGYQTGRLKQPALEPYVLEDLDSFFSQVGEKYETTVMVAHSQGGILAKLYVLKKLMARQGDSLSTDMIITLGTPHKGLWQLIPLQWLKKMPVIKTFRPLDQLADLSSRSNNLRNLRENWGEPYISADPCPPTATRRFVHSLAVIGAYDMWVAEGSAMGFDVDIPKYLSASHSALPDLSVQQRVFELIRDSLTSHRYPKSVMKSIRSIRAHRGGGVHQLFSRQLGCYQRDR